MTRSDLQRFNLAGVISLLCLASRFQCCVLVAPEPTMDKTKVRTFADKVYADMAGTMAVGMAYVGVKRGLFRVMADKGPMTAVHVAQASRLQPRYVEEWLKGMTCAGYLVYHPTAETFQLPDENAFLLASESTDHFMGGLFPFAPALLHVAPMVAEAFEKGGGVGFDEIGADGIEALDWLNCGQYEHRLISQCLTCFPTWSTASNKMASPWISPMKWPDALAKPMRYRIRSFSSWRSIGAESFRTPILLIVTRVAAKSRMQHIGPQSKLRRLPARLSAVLADRPAVGIGSQKIS